MFFTKFLSSKLTKRNLKIALQIAQEKKEKSAFVFDMDSTLFCMTYRNQVILKEAFEECSFAKKIPTHLKKFSNIQIKKTDWSVKEILSRYGKLEEPFLQEIEKIWKKKFFSNDYLYLDQPYKGVLKFLKRLAKSSNHIYYLTARNWNKMSRGTFETIKKYKLPLKKDSHLIMKKDLKLKDADYKTKHLESLSKQFDTVCFFENEPVILNQVSKSLPEIHLFWINSTHSRRERAPKKALTLSMTYSF